MAGSPSVIRSVALAVAACILAGTVARAQRVSSFADSAAVAAMLRSVTVVDSALAEAEARGDTAAMRRFFAPGYYSVAPDGEMINVRARLRRIAGGAKSTDSAQVLTGPWVRPLGGDAVLVTRSTRLWGTRHRAVSSSTTFRVTRLYVRQGDAWLLLFQQGSPLADGHIAGSGPGAPPHYPPD